jgi:hypothetical protein
MQPFSNEHMGVAIAYMLPGFVVLWGLSCFSPTIRMWLDGSAGASPTVGSFLYVILVSLGLGILTNIIRHLILDPVHRLTGIVRREWNYQHLQENIEAIEFLVLHQFRYYQFAGNTFLALIFSGVIFAIFLTDWKIGQFIALLLVEIFLWFGSRDILRTYYRRLEEVLDHRPEPIATEPISAA